MNQGLRERHPKPLVLLSNSYLTERSEHPPLPAVRRPPRPGVRFAMSRKEPARLKRLAVGRKRPGFLPLRHDVYRDGEPEIHHDTADGRETKARAALPPHWGAIDPKIVHQSRDLVACALGNPANWSDCTNSR